MRLCAYASVYRPRTTGTGVVPQAHQAEAKEQHNSRPALSIYTSCTFLPTSRPPISHSHTDASRVALCMAHTHTSTLTPTTPSRPESLIELQAHTSRQTARWFLDQVQHCAPQPAHAHTRATPTPKKPPPHSHTPKKRQPPLPHSSHRTQRHVLSSQLLLTLIATPPHHANTHPSLSTTPRNERPQSTTTPYPPNNHTPRMNGLND